MKILKYNFQIILHKNTCGKMLLKPSTWKQRFITHTVQGFYNLHNTIIIYRVSHKKRNGRFSVACDLKVPYLFTSSNQATPAEENDTKIIKFDLVSLILWPFVKTHFQISLDIFVTDERRIMLGMAFHCCVLRKPIDPCQQKKRGSMGFPKAL